MLYALVLTVFLGSQENNIPMITEVVFRTPEECLKALDTASFKTMIPHVRATAVCEKRPLT
jgi:hypothetical protein